MSIGAGGQAGPLGGAVAMEAVVSLLDGGELRGKIHNLNPQRPTFSLQFREPGGNLTSRQIRFDDVKMVSFLRDPAMAKSKVAFPSTSRLVTVRFLDDELVRGVAQSYGGARRGLFLVPTGLEDIERIYVPISAIRDVVSVKRLGDILVEKGMATPDMIERALEKQEQLRGDKLGEILVKNRAISDKQLAQGLSRQKQRGERRIGDILLGQGFIDRVQLDEALEAQASKRGRKLGQIMVDMGYATYKMIGIALAIQHNVPFIDISSQTIDPQLRKLVPEDFAKQWRIIPLSFQEKVLTIAVADPTGHSAQDLLREKTGLTVITVVATPQDISRVMTRFY
ncbi:MAG: hypothetical protein SWQ30_14260 [Thermodesulfobacteriota bacterium]|nr:hypothetical protein [Thermodesulfobacteriota bacterium]